MTNFNRLLVCLILLPFLCAAAIAEGEPSPPKPTEEIDFSPPPMPGFMLKKPERPLTLEEMQQQADAAARQANKDRPAPTAQPSAAAAPPSRPATTDAR